MGTTTAPKITAVQPSAGPAAGGTNVSIAGSGLSTATAEDVLFGTVEAAAVLSASDTLLVVVSPASTALGVVPISIVTGSGASVIENAFDYQMEVNSIYPVSGPVTGGTSLTIKGSGFLQVFGIQFNDIAAPSLVVSSDVELTVITPAGTGPGGVDLTFVGLTGQNEYIDIGAFTYTAAATTPATTGAGATTAASSTSATGAATSTTVPAAGSTAAAAAPPTTQPASATSAAPAGQPSATPAAGATGAVPAAAAAPGAAAAPAGSPGAAGSTGAPAGSPSAAGSTGAPAAASPSTPQPGNYIPGGAMIVPGGQTGLGGSAGTGAGFGVGTLMAGGGGSAAESNLPYYVDPGLTGQLVQTLIGLVQTAASPDAIEAQNMILRRMALEGDVVGSRIPPPRNISELGGYINLLGTMNEPTMREQALAGALGVAGPSVPLGWISNDQPLSMAAVTNDRPAVAAQASFPLTVLVRSDFVAGVQAMQKTLHGYGATLPFTSPSAIVLPLGGTGSTVPLPILFYIGRMLTIAPSAALANPASDPVAIISPDGGLTDCFLASQVLNPSTFQTPPEDIIALQGTPAQTTLANVEQVEFVPVAPVLAAAGFYSASPLPVPANTTQTAWAALTNTTGLVSGVTKLGDELSLLYRSDQIAASVFSTMLSWTWTGSTFSP